MKCDRCGRQITKKESYSHKGQTLCEDCYMEAGLHVEGCDPWATYTATRTGQLKGTESLSDLQQKVLDFVKSQVKATRKEAMAKFGLSEAQMDAQIAALMHLELIKERSEGDQFYLVPVSQ